MSMDDFGPHPSEPEGQSGGCLRVTVSAMIAALLIALLLHYSGSLDGLRPTAPEADIDTISAPDDSTIVTALRLFAKAQEKARKDTGKYAQSTDALIGMAGVEEKAARATGTGTPYDGYYFTCPTAYGEGQLKPDTEFIIIAEPVEYGTATRFTYAIGPKGIVLRKDLGGKAVSNISQIDRSWKKVE